MVIAEKLDQLVLVGVSQQIGQVCHVEKLIVSCLTDARSPLSDGESALVLRKHLTESMARVGYCRYAQVGANGPCCCCCSW